MTLKCTGNWENMKQYLANPFKNLIIKKQLLPIKKAFLQH